MNGFVNYGANAALPQTASGLPEDMGAECGEPVGEWASGRQDDASVGKGPVDGPGTADIGLGGLWRGWWRWCSQYADQRAAAHHHADYPAAADRRAVVDHQHVCRARR